MRECATKGRKTVGNEYYEPYSVEEYKGLKFGQVFVIEGKEYKVYRINDKRNEVTLISKHRGFTYKNVDDFLELIDK